MKIRSLRSDGVLSVAEGKQMAKQAEDQAVEKARLPVETAYIKLRNRYKRWFFEAVKEARKWKCTGKLLAVAVYETGKEYRFLKRSLYNRSDKESIEHFNK